MKNKEYWEERAILKDKLLEKDINKIEKKLLKLFKDTRKEVLNELKIIYADIEATEYEKYRIDSLVTSINMALDNLYKKNEEQVTEGLKEIYKRFDKEASIDLGASFNTINENLIREAIKTNWSGLSFSERIWEHRRRLAFTIKGELTKGLTRGDSLQDMSRIIADKLNNSYSNALRLVRTESCFIMNEATINNYKNNGIKEYEFMAFLDKKTSPQCRELDGKIISVEEYKAGLNFPPLHPNCRSCIVPVIKDIVIGKPKESIKEEKALNKDGQEIVFNFTKMKEDRRKIVIDTISELSNKYNTRLREVNDEANSKGVKGSVDLSFVMRLSTVKKNTIVHEFAHSLAMSRADKFGLTNDIDFWKEIKKVNREYKKAIREDSNKKISEYSLESIDEFMAEAFCHSYLKNTKHLGWEYGSDYEFSDKVMNIINKYFLKK